MLKKPGPWDWGVVTRGPGEKPECRRPSSIKTSRYWWRTDAIVKIVTFRIAANTMTRNGRRRIQLLTSDTVVKKKKAEFASFCSVSRKKKLNSSASVLRHRICGDPEGTNSNTSFRHSSIRENFDGRRTPAFRFLTQSGSDYISVSRTAFFLTSVAIQQSHRPGFFITFLT